MAKKVTKRTMRKKLGDKKRAIKDLSEQMEWLGDMVKEFYLLGLKDGFVGAKIDADPHNARPEKFESEASAFVERFGEEGYQTHVDDEWLEGLVPDSDTQGMTREERKLFASAMSQTRH